MLKLRAYETDAISLLYLRLFVPRMCTMLNMNCNNGKMRLVLKKTFKLSKDFYKESFSKIILHSVFLQTEELYA